MVDLLLKLIGFLLYKLYGYESLNLLFKNSSIEKNKSYLNSIWCEDRE